MSFENKKLNAKQPPKLILFCGLPGSGKTTLARKLAVDTSAVRLCPDERMADLGMDLFDEAARTKVEKRLWKLGQELLSLGQDVILENGLWSRMERDAKRRDAKKLGVTTELHYLDVPLAELVRRLKIRNTSGDYATVPITNSQIESYAKLFQPPHKTELALFDFVIVHKSST